MTTARDLITRSMRLMRVIGAKDTPDAEEMTDGLRALNAMLDKFWLEGYMVYRWETASHALTAGDGDYTIGTGGDINVTRPNSIPDAYIRYNTVDYPLEIIASQDYDSIPIKSISAIPDRLYYDPAYPLGVIYLFPVPVASMTLYYSSPKRLESFANLSDTIDLPPGYEDMLAYQLAVHYSPEFGVEPSPTVIAMARESKAIIKRSNTKQRTISVDSALLGGTGFNYAIPPT